MRKLGLAALLLFALSGAAHAENISGHELLERCEAVQWVTTVRANNAKAYLDAGYCLGYMTAFAQSAPADAPFCIPPKAGARRLAGVFTTVANNSPDGLDAAADDYLGFAFEQAYPCQR